MAEDPRQDIEISNPMLGKLAAHGVRVSDMISLLTFVGVIVLSIFSWKTAEAITEHKIITIDSNKQMVDSIKEAAAATRLMTCILSVAQERRENEFTQLNSFCRSMSRLP